VSGIEIETCWQRGTPISIGVCFRQLVIASRLVPASAHPPTTSIDSSTFPPVLQRLKFKGYTVWHYIAWLSESLCRMAFNHGTLTVTLE